MRTSVFLLALGVIAVGAVEIRTLFAGDFDVLGVECPDQCVAPTASWNGTFAGLRCIAWFHNSNRLNFIFFPAEILLRIPNTFQNGTGFQIQFYIGANTKSTGDVNTAGDHNSAAAGKEAIIDGFLDSRSLGASQA